MSSLFLLFLWTSEGIWLALGVPFLYGSHALPGRTRTYGDLGTVCWSRMYCNSSDVLILYLSWAAEKAQPGYKLSGGFILPVGASRQYVHSWAICLALSLLTQGACIKRGHMTRRSARLSWFVANHCGHTFLFLCSNRVINLCFPTHRPFLKAASCICWSTGRHGTFGVAVSNGTSKGVPSAAKPVGWERQVVRVRSQNPSGWNLCTPRRLSLLCALVPR